MSILLDLSSTKIGVGGKIQPGLHRFTFQGRMVIGLKHNQPHIQPHYVAAACLRRRLSHVRSIFLAKFQHQQKSRDHLFDGDAASTYVFHVHILILHLTLSLFFIIDPNFKKYSLQENGIFRPRSSINMALRAAQSP